MWWIILFTIIGLYILFRLFTFMFGNWRATLNRVITQYVAWKQMEPEYSDEQVFMALLDHRYPERTGFMRKMHERKDKIKESIRVEIESEMSVIDKYSLPILIYTCLLIEENNYLNSQKSVEEFLQPIIGEVKRQGFKKYC
ncbi:hypothetical protein A2661_02615 [Candidatus Giovannonibacteria bacterium RIFCSPHIGHO2_01_FULL_45_24]|uniref:Uncharacterized protein n=1 Tax=Candidatus Giovannonibacteria bacterium RIFCSPLOWO2_01_FULL_46_32 TaxID=1798353 RepID=A0A1F5XJH2_9BACT|nr:MAG: hypothetical protein A2661_02615 [Candidatus Giovannonibacteria bacterium RIFCSPHIGHO2_01_FULL_45_24]OGF87611.1 MAG: hypothetical protein A3B19_02335 [Candidatus Giovannonibacteria bacterium RIFCSPLOWO2_01_FULL_46_32]